ncbi:hypothetical protein ACWDOP_31765 [Nocardia sp. NPDC003693]
MFRITAVKPDGEHWHPHPGDAIEDHGEFPALFLCALGVVAVGLTLTAAGYGFRGWATIGAIAAAVLLTTGLLLIRYEYFREFKREQEVGRHGHNPLVAGEWRGTAPTAYQERHRLSAERPVTG